MSMEEIFGHIIKASSGSCSSILSCGLGVRLVAKRVHSSRSLYMIESDKHIDLYASMQHLLCPFPSHICRTSYLGLCAGSSSSLRYLESGP
jgi:hypothetical protein